MLRICLLIQQRALSGARVPGPGSGFLQGIVEHVFGTDPKPFLPAHKSSRCGRLWPIVSCQRGRRRVGHRAEGGQLWWPAMGCAWQGAVRRSCGAVCSCRACKELTKIQRALNSVPTESWVTAATCWVQGQEWGTQSTGSAVSLWPSSPPCITSHPAQQGSARCLF